MSLEGQETDNRQNDAVFKNCDITYVPIFLGGLMHKVCSLYLIL